ncbi:hypothetical protein AGR4B_pAt20308 [Agrobacterium tumefaciens str. CFBP 5621]|nr:hypothetical protein AGR4B_pAt20308 [Agrobacterium tumefaciens str. CFBP 5621]
MQLEFTIDTPPFVRPDQPLMTVANRMQRPIQGRLPEIEEFAHFREIRSEVVVLPDIGLEDGFEVGNAIEDMRCGKAITVELPLKIRRKLHASSPFHDRHKNDAALLRHQSFFNFECRLLFLYSMLAAAAHEC